MSDRRTGIAVILSPYRADNEAERREYFGYRQDCIRDAVSRSWAPYASHQMMTDAFNDEIEEEREIGMRCEHAFMAVAERVLVYIDHGISDGMLQTLNGLWITGKTVPIEFIRLKGEQP